MAEIEFDRGRIKQLLKPEKSKPTAKEWTLEELEARIKKFKEMLVLLTLIEGKVERINKGLAEIAWSFGK